MNEPRVEEDSQHGKDDSVVLGSRWHSAGKNRRGSVALARVRDTWSSRAPLEEVSRMFQKDRCVTFGSRGGPSFMLDKGSWSWWISYVSQADMVRFWAVRRMDANVDR